jgi:hypothetical protein
MAYKFLFRKHKFNTINDLDHFSPKNLA